MASERLFRHTYEQPPLIPAESPRGYFMNRAKLREQCRANDMAHMPGYRSARVTRAYTPEEVAQRKGIGEQQLRDIARRGVKGIPLLVRHSWETPAAGHALEAVYDEHDKFLYLRSQLSLDNPSSTAAYVHEEQQKGNLLYMSMKFTVPDHDYPDPERFPSQITEVSFVDTPHEPHAEVLIAHSRTDSSLPQRILSLCARIDQMSSAPETPATPTPAPADAPAAADKRAPTKTAQINADDLKKLIEEHAALSAKAARAAELEKELSGYQQRHQESMKPRLERISKYLAEQTNVPEDHRKLVAAMVQDVSADHKTAGIAEWLDATLSENEKIKAELAKLHEERQQQTSSSAEMSDLLRQASTSAAPAGAHSSASAPPLVAAHQASAPRSSGLAARIRRLADTEFGLPLSKRVAQDSD